jgi:hypothetical protein
MNTTLPYQQLADAVLMLHFSIVIFVVAGLALIVAGNLRRWSWVNRLWFRIAHLAAIAVVIAESWLGITCPLTTLESWLRSKAGQDAYPESFIEYWLQYLLYYKAPWWVFALVHTVFGLLVAAAWWYFPPALKRQGPERDA